jgi:hypothetical protein
MKRRSRRLRALNKPQGTQCAYDTRSPVIQNVIIESYHSFTKRPASASL